jgi:hypothetical protein
MSKAEAAYYSYHLKPQLDDGRISDLEFQPRIKCEVGGTLVCTYIADFRYQDLNNETIVIEVKGYETDIYKLKMKLVRALHPQLKILVIYSKQLNAEISSLLPQE